MIFRHHPLRFLQHSTFCFHNTHMSFLSQSITIINFRGGLQRKHFTRKFRHFKQYRNARTRQRMVAFSSNPTNLFKQSSRTIRSHYTKPTNIRFTRSQLRDPSTIRGRKRPPFTHRHRLHPRHHRLYFAINTVRRVRSHFTSNLRITRRQRSHTGIFFIDVPQVGSNYPRFSTTTNQTINICISRSVNRHSGYAGFGWVGGW